MVSAYIVSAICCVGAVCWTNLAGIALRDGKPGRSSVSTIVASLLLFYAIARIGAATP